VRRPTRRTIGTLVFVSALVLTGGVRPGASQTLPGLSEREAEPDAQADPLTPEAISARSAAVDAELADSEAALAQASHTGSRRPLELRRDGLQEVQSLLREQLTLLRASDSSEPAQAVAASPAPPSPFALNALYEARRQAEAGREQKEEAVALAREALSAAKERFETAERERRETRDRLAAAPAAEAESRHQAAVLESRLAQERVNLRTLELRQAEAVRDAGSSTAELESAIAQMRRQLARGEGDLRAGMEELARREGELRRSREAIARRLSTVELRLEALRQRFSTRQESDPSALEEIESVEARRDAIRQEAITIDARLEHLAQERSLWHDWDAVLRRSAERSEREAFASGARERLEALSQEETQRQGRAADIERRLALLATRIESQEAPPRLRSALIEQREALTQLLATQRAEMANLASDRAITERFLAEFEGGPGLRQLAERGLDGLRGLWRYEITSVADEALTVGSLILALFFFGAGFWASRRAASLVGRVSARRFRLDAGAAHAVQSLTFYVLWISFTVLALRAVHFPLTVFTVLGGAIAIGIGFGSQNVMNNFISGLILMLERPVRARDVVEVDGNHGTIENIGARSTQIRSTDGRYIVVPNSFFLESNVVNWTLSDELIRTKVSVGVVYGSPTRLAAQLIRRIVDEDEGVLPAPEPVVLFQDFADNSLNFDVHFWVNARSPMEVGKVQSRIRFRIDDLFREHGIVIAFPQRDVHLDSVAPIEVRMVRDDRA
jgi:small-conductance mechanosensitive channel